MTGLGILLRRSASLLVQWVLARSLGLNQTIRKFLLYFVEWIQMTGKILLFKVWDHLAMEEMLPFHKLLTGGFRMGVSKGNLCKALARVGEWSQP